MFFCKNTSLLIGGSLTHKTSTGARTGIVRCPDGHCPVPGRASADLLRDFLKFPALVRHRTMPAKLESYDINFKQKSSGACPMCANAGRAPAGHRTVADRCHFTLVGPTNRRTGAVEF